MKAWHFVADTLRDGRFIPKDGVWLVHDGEVEMCWSGLHASIDIYDAGKYAPGNTLCRVELTTRVKKDFDKIVGCRRKILWRIDFTEALKAYARWCATRVLHLWEAPDDVRDFLFTGNNAPTAAYNNASYVDAYASAAAYNAAYYASRADASRADASASAAATSAAYYASAAASAAASTNTAEKVSQRKILLEFAEEARQGITEWEFY